MVPNLVAAERLRGALALNYGLYQLTMVAGPGLGGLVVALFGVQWAYTLDAGSCLGHRARRAPSRPPAAARDRD